MNGHVYWKDLTNWNSSMPEGAEPLTIDDDIVDVILNYFNTIISTAGVVSFTVVKEPAEDGEWGFYAGTIMEIFEDYYTYIEPAIYPWQETPEEDFIYTEL